MYTARVFRDIFIITVILLSYSMLSAQIKIKERVEIKPLPKVLTETNSSPASVHIEFTAGTTNQIRLACPYSIIYGYNTITADVCNYDRYYYQVSCFKFAEQTDVPYHIIGTVGSIVLFEYEGVWSFSPGFGYAGDYLTIGDPFGKFDVMTGWNVCEGEQTTIDFDFDYLPECSNDNYYMPNYDPIVLTVTQGQELGKLCLNDKPADGNSLTLTYSEYIYPNKIGFRVNEALPEGFTGGTVTIRATAGSIDKSASFDVYTCNPQCILAIAEKSPLPVGDTTTLSFIYTDTGNPVPADKKIDISVLGGSDGENGYLSAGGITDISFGGASQPIQYIAPLSITGDSLIVPIRASLNMGGGIPMKIQNDDSIKSSPVKINKMISQTMSECEIGSVTVENYRPCADAPQCSTLFERSPIMMIQPQPNGFQGKNVCSSADDLGGFQNFVGSFTPIIVDPCYDMQSEEWRFPIMNVIEINVIMDICRDNIINQRKQKLIKSVGEVVPADSSLALQDFKDHYPPNIYPAFPSREGGYVLEEVLWLHENTHKYHYEVMIAQSRDSLFDKPYQELRFACEAIKDIDKVKERIEKRLNDLMYILTNNVNDEWVYQYGQSYEERTHSSVKTLVDSYILELQNKYNVK